MFSRETIHLLRSHLNCSYSAYRGIYRNLTRIKTQKLDAKQKCLSSSNNCCDLYEKCMNVSKTLNARALHISSKRLAIEQSKPGENNEVADDMDASEKLINHRVENQIDNDEHCENITEKSEQSNIECNGNVTELNPRRKDALTEEENNFNGMDASHHCSEKLINHRVENQIDNDEHCENITEKSEQSNIECNGNVTELNPRRKDALTEEENNFNGMDASHHCSEKLINHRVENQIDNDEHCENITEKSEQSNIECNGNVTELNPRRKDALTEEENNFNDIDASNHCSEKLINHRVENQIDNDEHCENITEIPEQSNIECSGNVVNSRRNETLTRDGNNFNEVAMEKTNFSQFYQPRVAGEIVEMNPNTQDDVTIKEGSQWINSSSTELTTTRTKSNDLPSTRFSYKNAESGSIISSLLREDADGTPALIDNYEDLGIETLDEEELPLKVDFPKIHHLAPLVSETEVLRNLVKLGVDLSKLEKEGRAGKVVKMDFNRDVKPLLLYLHDIKVPGHKVADLLNRCSALLTMDLDHLKTKILYLRSKKFKMNDILKMIDQYPKFLSLSTVDLDTSLGFLQKHLWLTGGELRATVKMAPKLITMDSYMIQNMIYALQDDVGLTRREIKQVVKNYGGVFTKLTTTRVVECFDYLHKEMGIPHSLIIAFPQALRADKPLRESRHQFLVMLGGAQYDPNLPNFVSLERLLLTEDTVFSCDVAKASLAEYNDYLRTL